MAAINQTGTTLTQIRSFARDGEKAASTSARKRTKSVYLYIFIKSDIKKGLFSSVHDFPPRISRFLAFNLIQWKRRKKGTLFGTETCLIAILEASEIVKNIA